MSPEDILVTKLQTLFPDAQIGPAGTTVYHADGDPILPYILYRRTSTGYERDLQGNCLAQLVEFDVMVESKFFSDTVEVTMPDNWVASNWSWEMYDQETDSQDFEVVFSYKAFSTIF